MEKRPFPVFPRIAFLFSVLSMTKIVLLTVEAVIGYIQMPEGASGVDYLGFLMYPILCMPMALVGAISSAFCGIKTTITWVKVVSFIMLAVCLVILFPFVAFLLRWRGVLTVIREAVIWFVGLL